MCQAGIGWSLYEASLPPLDRRCDGRSHPSPIRVAIYADIVGSDCSQNCSNFLKVSDKAIPKSTLSQHFKASEKRV